MSKANTLKIDAKKASIGQLRIGENINSILTYVQLNVALFGKVEVISPKEHLD